MTRFLAGTASAQRGRREGGLQTENVFRRQAQATRRRPVVSTDKYGASLFAARTKARERERERERERKELRCDVPPVEEARGPGGLGENLQKQ